MKTHKEIHDAITSVSTDEFCSPAEESIIDILHALNDRIEALERNTAERFSMERQRETIRKLQSK